MGNCVALTKSLTCTNGAWTNNGLVTNQSSYFSGCIDINTQSCNASQIGLGTGIIPHTTSVTMYTTALAFETNNDICNNHVVHVQCLNHVRSGYVP